MCHGHRSSFGTDLRRKLAPQTVEQAADLGPWVQKLLGFKIGFFIKLETPIWSLCITPKMGLGWGNDR